MAARGLDVKDIKYVVNIDLPQNIDDYVHRIGRTGRAGQKGYSLSLFSENDLIIVSPFVNFLLNSKAKVHPFLMDSKKVRKGMESAFRRNLDT